MEQAGDFPNESATAQNGAHNPQYPKQVAAPIHEMIQSGLECLVLLAQNSIYFQQA